ncbi:MAG: hypothetical protein U5L01_16380 [Rheinheimera sp.]|nr:hypothetical protein [Rheinheimera sp.]
MSQDIAAYCDEIRQVNTQLTQACAEANWPFVSELVSARQRRLEEISQILPENLTAELEHQLEAMYKEIQRFDAEMTVVLSKVQLGIASELRTLSVGKKAVAFYQQE